MLKLKIIIPYIIVGMLGILLLNLIASNYLSIADAANRIQIEEVKSKHIIGTLYCFLLGLLIEWRTIIRLFKRDIKLNFSPLFIFGIIILAISCVAPASIVMRFGICAPFPISIRLLSFFFGPLSQSSNIQNILAVIAGCIIIRGVIENKIVEK